MSNKKNLKIGSVILIVIITILTAFFTLNNFESTAYAANFSPTTTIDQLYDADSGKFDMDGFDELAEALGYDDMGDLLADKTNIIGTPNAAGEYENDSYIQAATKNISIKLGSYTPTWYETVENDDGTTTEVLKTGDPIELEWIPTYISGDKDGHLILTLWLAYTQSANSDSVGYQELSTYSNGTYYNGGSPQPLTDKDGNTVYIDSKGNRFYYEDDGTGKVDGVDRWDPSTALQSAQDDGTDDKKVPRTPSAKASRMTWRNRSFG
jgi:hypothetical protein